jgi:uncharacterized lipoprotein YddW (UPF0748 family)
MEQLRSLLDRAAAMRLNAILFQVRPAADAVYKSSLEPWSPWLTGKMGQPPDLAWDPLEFAIQEAHARGMELHAWFNPFRALSSSNRFRASADHVTVQHADWCFDYGDSTWMNPGIPAVRERAKAVILDVVRRYDVDGVHMDDYFYPYPVNRADGSAMPVPDSEQYDAYKASGGALELRGWRRSGIDAFISSVYAEVKAVKRWVQVGISPFGLWRPGHPAGTGGGLDPYEDLAADSRKWLQSGWVDYLAPQLYWHTDDKKLSFPVFYQWWQQENTLQRHIYPGMAVDRVGTDRGGIEILRQISAVRQLCRPRAPGHLHWNLGELLENTMQVADLTLKRGYVTVAVPPASPWLTNEAMPLPVLARTKLAGKWHIQWGTGIPGMASLARRWSLQAWDGKSWRLIKVYPSSMRRDLWPAGARAVAVRALGRCWEQGPAAMLRLN